MTLSYTSPVEHREFYDKRWSEGSDGFGVIVAARVLWISEILAAKRMELGRPLRILDFGCGQGRYAALAMQFGTVDAIDYSETGIEVARRAYPGPNYQCMDAYNFTSEYQYDAILSIEVLEHMPDQQRYCELIRMNLTEGGQLLLTMPNQRAAAKYWADKRHANTAQPIEKWLTRRDLHELLVANGLHPTELSTRYVGYRRDGIGKLINSVKLNKMTARAPRRLMERLGIGLHLFACAIKR